MINLVLFAFTFLIWLYLTVKNKNNKWYTCVFAFLWGAFLCQTILGMVGWPTIVSLIIK